MKINSKALIATLVFSSACALVQAEDYGSPGTGPQAPRTGLYAGTTMGNPATDNTVDDYTKRPTLLNGKQYFAGYGDNSFASGAYAFNAAGFDWFGSIVTPVTHIPIAARNAGFKESGTLRTGLANNLWGAGLIWNFNKTSSTNGTQENKFTLENDGFGLFGNFNLHGSDVYGEASMRTGFPDDTLPYTKSTNPPAAASEYDPSTIHFMAGWKKDATTEGTHSLNVEASMDFSSIDPPTPKTSGTNIAVNFYHGYILKSTAAYAVFLGSTATYSMLSIDNPTPFKDPSHTHFALMPNMAFQKILGKGFEITTGGSAGLSYDMYKNATNPANIAGDEGAVLITPVANVQVGARWVLDNFAFEGSVNQNLLSNGPNFISGTAPTPMFAQIGVSLGI